MPYRDSGNRLRLALSKQVRRSTVSLTVAFLSVLSFALAPAGAADPIYRWTDSEGKVHFSTEPGKGEAAAPAQLPTVKKENLDEKIKAIRSSTPPSCEQHGGLDCSRGADQDGSVICLDGYRDAKLPFRFNCMEARIQTDLIVLVAGDKGFIKHGPQLKKRLGEMTPTGLQLNVRNLAGVKAIDVSAELTFPREKPQPIKGPSEIDPYGSTDYLIPFDTLPRVPTIDELQKVRYSVRCTNCASVGTLVR